MVKHSFTLYNEAGDVLERHLTPATLTQARTLARQEAAERGAPGVLHWGAAKRLYVEPEGHISELYRHDGRLGCVALWRSRATGTEVGLYHARQAGIESDPECRWAVVCEKHGTLVCHPTLAEARRTRSGREFCDECQAKE